MRLKNKVVVVTGAGSGMGKAIAERFASEGASVVAADLNPASLQAVVNGIAAQGGQVTAVTANMAIEAEVEAMIDTAFTTYGKLDILVNNAGIMDDLSPVGDVSNTMWEKVFAVNVTGPMQAMRKAVQYMLKNQGGAIINVTSAGGLQGARAGASYTAAKHAMIGVTKNTAYMYAQQGIRCNAIAPGGVETNIQTSMTNVNQFGAGRQYTGMATMPRVGKPEEIANAALFLASDESSFVNGAVLVADAGWLAY